MLSKETLVKEIIREKILRKYPMAGIEITDLKQLDETELDDFYGEIYDFLITLFVNGQHVSYDGKYFYSLEGQAEGHIVRLYQLVEEIV